MFLEQLNYKDYLNYCFDVKNMLDFAFYRCLRVYMDESSIFFSF